MAGWIERFGLPGGGGEPPGTIAPFSFAQEEMWHHYLLDPNDPIYNEYDAILIDGPLDRAALEFAIAGIAARHDAFRVRFTESRAQPVIVYQEQPSFPLRFIDAAHGCASVAGHTDVPRATASAGQAVQGETSIDAWVRRIVREPVDLRAEPARATLVQLAPDRHLFVILMHHIIKDGTTESILMRDLSHFYARHEGVQTGGLQPIETSLAGYARWQRRLEAAGAFGDNLDYWTQELRGVRPADIPGDRHRPSILSTEGAKAYHTIARATVQRLRDVARGEQASLYMLLSAAYALLLRRYSGATDVPIAFPVANRMSRTAEIVGCFIHSLVFRPRFEEADSFRDFLRRSRDILSEAYRRQDVPFTQVAARLDSVRRADQSAIAAASLLMRNPKWEKLQLPGCRTERIDADVGVAKLDLVLELEELADGLFCKLEYRSSLYTPETARALLENFEALLAAVSASPDESIRSIDVISKNERAALRRWGAGPTRKLEGTLVSTFEAQAKSAGDRIAIVDGARTMTYAQLDAAATRIAEELLAASPHALPGAPATAGPPVDSESRGPAVGSESQPPRAIAICCDRSLEAIVAILAILKSGAPYLALDPRHPAERLRFMLDDAGAALILTTRATAGELPSNISVRYIEEILAASAGEMQIGTGCRDESRPGSRDAAYVMYTSGSTGNPNGVVVEHRSVLNYVAAFRDALGLDERDRISQFASLGFDISVEEIFGALCTGASLGIAPAWSANSVRVLLDECAARGVTVLDLPTAYFHEMAAALAENRALAWPSSIRAVVVGGEPLRTSDARVFLANLPDNVRLFNTYGPTETTVAVTMLEIDAKGLDEVAAALPVGRPIQNIEIAILDDALQPVPSGAIGELFVSGAALARGYLWRPELTAKRFIEDAGRGRIYATGDRARFRRDGIIELCGRIDDQLKVRGFRLEPAEVEAALLRDDAIGEAAVVSIGGELAACIVGKRAHGDDDDALDFLALRERLQRRLPPEMLPDQFVQMTALPLTVNGKRDRPALITAAHSATAEGSNASTSGGNLGKPSTSPSDAPRSEALTPTQARLKAIWEESFGRSVGLHDDFFALGGHSLLAARIFSRIEAKMGRRLPLQQLFVRPTIAGISQALMDERLHVSSFVSMHESQRHGKPIFFLHNDNSGGALYTRALARRLKVDRPLCVLAPHGGAGEPLPPSIEAIAEDYLAMIKAIQPSGPYVIGGHCMGGLIAIEIARRLREGGDDVTHVFAVQPPSPHYALSSVVSGIQRIAHVLSIPLETTLRMQTALKKAWRFACRVQDPRRRGRTVRELRDRALGFLGGRRWLTLAPSLEADGLWKEALIGAQSRLADRFNPRRFDGRLSVVRGRDSIRELAEVWAWRRAATEVRIVWAPGDHSTCFTEHQEALAELLSRELRAEWTAQRAGGSRRIAAAL